MRMTADSIPVGYTLATGLITRAALTGNRYHFKTTNSPQVCYNPSSLVEILGVPAEFVTSGDRSIHGPTVEKMTEPYEGILRFEMSDGTTQTYSTGETFYLWRY